MLNNSELTTLFERFSQVKVLIVGDVMIDSYIWGKVDRISPEAPVPVVSVTRRENMPGGAANVALNIKSLGATPILCSVTGNDARGQEFNDLMTNAQIDPGGIIRSPGRITTTKFRIIGNKTQMLRVDEEVDHDLLREEFVALSEKIEHMLNTHKIDIILLQDYNKGVLSPQMIAFLLSTAKTRGIPVVADPKSKNFELYQGIHLFKPNLKELKDGLKQEKITDNKVTILAAIEQLQKSQRLDMVMVTMSEKGILLRYKQGESFQIQEHPAMIRHIADVSGAGDTVISVAALCIALGVSPSKMAFLANLAGGIVCEYAGVVPVDKSRLFKEANDLFQF